MEEIIILIRAIIQDLEAKGKDFFTYDNETTFTLTEANLISGSIKVYVNGVSITGFLVDYDTCKVKITTSLVVGDSIEIYYSYYSQYSDTELEKYIYATLAYLSVNQVCANDFKIKDSELYPNPSLRERRLIALMTSVLTEPNLRSYRTPDFSFVFNEDETKEQKIRKLIRLYKSKSGIFDTL